MFMLNPTDPIPSREELGISPFDDEYMLLFYFVNYGDSTEKYKTMADLNDKQRSYINRRLAQIEKLKKIKIDKKRNDLAYIKHYLNERQYKYEDITITTENRRKVCTIIHPSYTHGRADLEETWLLSDLRDCLKKCYYKSMQIIIKNKIKKVLDF